MKLDKFGYWIMNDVVKSIVDGPEEDGKSEDPDAVIFTDDPEVKAKLEAYNREKKLKGKCVLSIRFENHGDYLRWKKYFGVGRQWEFMTSYPAIMRAEYEFTNSLEVEVMAKKVVQLLEAGFNVYSASWQLDENQNKERYMTEEDEEK